MLLLGRNGLDKVIHGNTVLFSHFLLEAGHAVALASTPKK
jgi:hypothetical protein